MALAPISDIGTRTVVRGGRVMRATRVSSKPASRENGGVYTHAATWAIAAACKLRDQELVGRLLTSMSAAEYRLRSLTYQDANMDVDDSGRFNSLDVDALTSLVGSTDPNHLSRWDFDGSDAIDVSDVAVMDSLVQLDFASGLLGDSNRDGILDCSDLAGINPYFVPIFPEQNLAFDETATSDTWTQVDLSTVVPTNITTARVIMFYSGDSATSGDVYFDVAYAERGSMPSVNQLSNWSFEYGPGGANGVTDWTEICTSGTSEARKSCFEVPGYDDLCSARATGEAIAGLFQDITVTAGETLDLSAYLYTPSADQLTGSGVVGVKVEWVGGNVNYQCVKPVERPVDRYLSRRDQARVRRERGCASPGGESGF